MLAPPALRGGASRAVRSQAGAWERVLSSLFLEGFDAPDDLHNLARDLRLASAVVSHR